ncbi:Pyruvate/2-oxoglutarate dehydrogenase complex, dihydrolipoamide dehydrogenase (E3) component [Pseudoxanthomonas sp. GM95]|uniref:NAD(P)/FAD-dependent oxidoreductase n=1 Tax=Pseudoxanthomonas sp. GM95 TaxID=1881043 RepID=UPI0008C2ABC2|nr:FAD/NAD(P)-binding oxidoreductase [Pseudoxanthomonas sp. GM95]SEL16043.1 Pyruvate/2-oxoglutarate dehydrogenase complex, dihydrolipoamide dehydrogenase (E3) component [Pseudoxanthomonas sp. GM95]
MTESVRHYEVLVVGAGPAGLAAAKAAALHGARVGLVDAQPRAGGQVWRHDIAHGVPAIARRALAAIEGEQIEFLAQAQIALAQPGWLLADGPGGARKLHYRNLVLATGARELLLPFPGWTLPGVTGAGGAQALAKQGWPLAGKRVLIAGSGPLLLASAATLRRHGARVLGIHEQASSAALARFALQLPRWPAKAAQALVLQAQLAGVGYQRGSVVVAAHGDTQVREVEIEGPRGRCRIACDQLAVGYGLVPNVELAQLLGCRLERTGAHPQVAVDAQLRSSVEHVFAAGEALGIGGRDCALIEGAIAGHMAAGNAKAAQVLLPRRRQARAFATLLQQTFALDHRVHALAQDDTLVCRCEDVPLGQLRGFSDQRDAKLASRCGMGACQGRICGTALAELGLADPRLSTDDGRRPPLFPVRLAALAGLPTEPSFTDDSQGIHP